MRHSKIQLGLSASLLASLFALFAVAPWASTNSGVDLTLYNPTLFAFCTVAIVIIWLDFIVMSDTPSNKLLATTKGKHELLWRLAGTLGDASGPWRLKRIAGWLGYRGVALTVLALTWYYVRYDQSLSFLIVIFSVPTLLASALYLTFRSTFELWAYTHRAAVERSVASLRVQNVLEHDL